MNDEKHTFQQVIQELKAHQSREREILNHLTQLLEDPDLADHIKRVFKLAREAFHEDAARFLIHPHWKFNSEAPLIIAQNEEGAREVEALLGNIIHGVSV
jgi:uncharacterized protein (DUF2384 family)